MQQQMRTLKKPLFIGLLDLAQAFDRVPPAQLWQALATYGTPPTLLAMVNLLYSQRQASVKVGDKLSRVFRLFSGVKQGCPLSPLLFLVFLDKITTLAELQHTAPGIPWHQSGTVPCVYQIWAVLYANDVTVISKSAAELSLIVNTLATVLAAHGMRLNIQKSHYLACFLLPEAPPLPEILVDGKELTRVRSATCLGYTLSEDGYFSDAITARTPLRALEFQPPGALPPLP